MESAAFAAPASVVAPIIIAAEDEHTYNTRRPGEFSLFEAHAVLNLRSTMEDKSLACSDVDNLRPQSSSKCKKTQFKGCSTAVFFCYHNSSY
jgi:hypothetical protein